jgi:hypothetical protein
VSAVAHTCNPSYLGREQGRITIWGQSERELIPDIQEALEG